MTENRCKSGAFVFTRARGIEPKTPAEIEPLLARHGIDPGVMPSYAGDRAAVGRAFTVAKTGLGKEGLLLRPIKRSATELVFGVVKETTDVIDQRLEHEFEAVIRWTAEPEAGDIEGEHFVARRVADAYHQLRGRISADDWSSTISAFLETHDAARVRSDGRIYWVPPQRVDEVRRLGAFLADIGIDLILCELEPEARQVVQGVAQDNLDEQLERLQAEVAEFDGKQRPSTYARRLDEFQRLRERAVLYRDALGVGVDRAEAVLGDLERKVTEMFELRSSTVVNRDGGTTEDSPKPAATTESLLRFAGADFTHKETAEGVSRFISDDPGAQTKIKTLEKIGIAGCWQTLGQAAVRIANSGPAGERVSISVRVPAGKAIHDCARSLSAIGIEVRGGTS